MKLLSLAAVLFMTTAMAKDYPPVRIPLIKETTLITKELSEQNPNTPVCMFARKDYDSEGFGLAYREGFTIKGQFGCMYYCGYQGKAWYVTHVFHEEHFDSDIWSKETGGPKRAKWFICPHSVDENSWKPFRDELGRIIGYQVDPDYSFFEPREVSSITELTTWENSQCR